MWKGEFVVSTLREGDIEQLQLLTRKKGGEKKLNKRRGKEQQKTSRPRGTEEAINTSLSSSRQGNRLQSF